MKIELHLYMQEVNEYRNIYNIQDDSRITITFQI